MLYKYGKRTRDSLGEFLVSGNARMLNTLLSNFCSIICQMVGCERLRTTEKFKLLALKSVRGRLWILMRGGR